MEWLGVNGGYGDEGGKWYMVALGSQVSGNCGHRHDSWHWKTYVVEEHSFEVICFLDGCSDMVLLKKPGRSRKAFLVMKP